MIKDNTMAKIKMAFKVVLVLCLLVYFNTSDLLAEDITEGANWASNAMQRWQDYGILSGTSNGVLAPTDELTKVEAITILNRINNVDIETNKDESKFKDVETFRWYYDEIEKAVATGLITGDSSGNINPKDLLSREVAFTMIAKLFDISYQGSDARSYLEENYPNDYDEIGKWCSSSIAGLLELGYIDGYEDGSLRPKQNVTRGEFITLIDNIIDVIIMEGGNYDLSEFKGNIVINTTGVRLDSINNDSTIYMMAGSNNEVVKEEKTKAIFIEAGMVRSNIDYSSYKADIDDLRRKKIVEYKILHNMPTVDDLSDELAATYGGKIRGTDKWNELIYKVSKEEEVDPVFVKCIMALESSGTSGLKSKMNNNGTYDYGLMQVNSSWSTSFDLNRMLIDDEYAIRCGIKVIKRKIEAAERSGKGASIFEVAWRYNGYNNQGKKYAQRFATLYEDLSGMSADSPVRVMYGENCNNTIIANIEKERENTQVIVNDKDDTKEAKLKNEEEITIENNNDKTQIEKENTKEEIKDKEEKEENKMEVQASEDVSTNESNEEIVSD
ncbi:MAG: S-layer homology domain-containing protein [Clostridia bacterium]|nr:S-layer homology domain-containing protein [Clostridia bacterium]